jgi:hypothetical protein
MKQLSILILLACAVFILTIRAPSGSEEVGKSVAKKAPASQTRSETGRVYPIAPGVWYPGDGPIPEHPVRYYRVRCWPGCHRGSSHGKYPDKPLNMKPIFPTSTVASKPGA